MWLFLVGLIIWGLGLFSSLRRADCKTLKGKDGKGFDLKKVLKVYGEFVVDKWQDFSDRYAFNKNRNYVDYVSAELKLVNPQKKEKILYKEHLVSKISVSLLILLLVFVIGLLLSLTNSKGELDGLILYRNDYGKGDKQVSLEASFEDKTKDFSFSIQERKYSEKEILEIFQEEFSFLKANFYCESESVNRISNHVNMPDTTRDGMIMVNWRLSDYEVLDGDGNINEDALEEKLNKTKEDSFPMEVTVCLTYKEVKREESFNCEIVKKDYTKEEALERAIKSELKSIDESMALDENYNLPEEVNGVKVNWKEKKNDSYWGLFVLGLLGVVAIFIGKDVEIKERIKDRNRQMELDYPEFVSKLTLMISAGVSLFNAWCRICDSYLEEQQNTGKERYLYEEMVITMREIQSGEEEITSFERFGDRVKVPCYKKFSSILVQSMKKGLGGLRESLEFEVKQSFEIRKANALRLGEEASTKLLLPMGIMLLIVLVIIVAPAFMSLSI